MNWTDKTRLDDFKTIDAAAARYYKPSRFGDLESRRARVAWTERWIAEEGHAILSSPHESVTGRGLWIRPEGSGFAVYEG